MARNGRLTETVRFLAEPEMKAELQAMADAKNRSVGAIARAAIRSYLLKGKR